MRLMDHLIAMRPSRKDCYL